MYRIWLMFLALMTTVLLNIAFMGNASAAGTELSARAGGMAKITDVRVGKSADNVRLVVDADREITFKQMILANPTRIVVDIENAWLGTNTPRSLASQGDLASAIRIAQFDSSTVRIVIETSVDKSRYKVFSLKGGKSPGRVVVDLGVGFKEGMSVKSAEQKTDNKPAPVSPKGSEDNKKPLVVDKYKPTGGLRGKVIAIDPGHGGSDSGAIGPTGVMEKNVTLNISRELKKILEIAGAKVIMTRESDVEVHPKKGKATDIEELSARCEVANKADADVFLSIHIDAFVNREASGTTVYRYVRGSENSKLLADSVRVALIDKLGTQNRGTQTSEFYVIKHTDMPAILVEVGFLTNEREEQMLNSKQGVINAAQGIADGLAEYFR